MQIGHVDGFEENTARTNLYFVCRAHNARAAAVFKRLGLGRRTVQYNPSTGDGASSVGQWLTALSVIHGESEAMSVPAAVSMIHATPAAARSKFAKSIWRVRRKHYGRTGRSDSVPF